MTRIFLLLGLLPACAIALSACDLPQSYAQRPASDQVASDRDPTKPGVRVSGYARMGVSHRF